MNKNSAFFAGMLLGAAAGAALAWFLTTDKGKEVVEEARAAVKSGAEKIKKTVSDLKDDISESLDGAECEGDDA